MTVILFSDEEVIAGMRHARTKYPHVRILQTTMKSIADATLQRLNQGASFEKALEAAFRGIGFRINVTAMRAYSSGTGFMCRQRQNARQKVAQP